MKKRCFAAVLALLMTVALGAQEGAGLLSAGDLERYTKPFLNSGGVVSSKYTRAASRGDRAVISALGGDEIDVDSPLEIALLSTCAGVVDIHPVMAPEIEAILPANNPKQADLKLGAAVFQEMQVLRFLGDTAAVGRHEGILQFITGRGNATRAEVETFYRNGIGSFIAGTVDEKFKDIAIAANTKTTIKQAITNFFLTPNQTTYNGLKRYKYPDGKPYDGIELAEFRAENALESAKLFEASGNVAQAEFFRTSAESSRNLANTMKTANAYIYTLQSLSPVLADKVLQDSR